MGHQLTPAAGDGETGERDAGDSREVGDADIGDGDISSSHDLVLPDRMGTSLHFASNTRAFLSEAF